MYLDLFAQFTVLVIQWVRNMSIDMKFGCFDRMDVGVVEIILQCNGYWKNISRTERKKNMNMEIKRPLDLLLVRCL